MLSFHIKGSGALNILGRFEEAITVPDPARVKKYSYCQSGFIKSYHSEFLKTTKKG
jgi:hypothetical protein